MRHETNGSIHAFKSESLWLSLEFIEISSEMHCNLKRFDKQVDEFDEITVHDKN